MPNVSCSVGVVNHVSNQSVRHSLKLHWFADLMNVTEEVTIHRPNVSTLLSSAFIRGDLNAATRGPFIWSLISGLFFFFFTPCQKNFNINYGSSIFCKITKVFWPVSLLTLYASETFFMHLCSLFFSRPLTFFTHKSVCQIWRYFEVV